MRVGVWACGRVGVRACVCVCLFFDMSCSLDVRNILQFRESSICRGFVFNSGESGVER